GDRARGAAPRTRALHPEALHQRRPAAEGAGGARLSGGYWMTGLPSRSPGRGTSSSFNTDGDTSMMCGLSVLIFRFTNSTPPLISAAVAQWSPLHLRL